MTGLDDLRAALREPPAAPFAEPDLARIMADGTRLRRRRQALRGAGALTAAAAVVLVVVGAVGLRRPAPEIAPAAPPPLPSSVAVRPAPAPSDAGLPPEAYESLGEVIATGLKAGGGDLVLYVTKVDEPQILPGIHFGLMAGTRDAAGKLHPALMSNETKGSDTSFGFHATDGGENDNGQTIPVFGYFSGPVAKITTTVHGKTLVANLSRWSQDPQITVFWFDPAAAPAAAGITPLIAYDANGKRLTK